MDFYQDPQFLQAAGAGLAFASVVLPLLEKGAKATKNKTDDKIVHAVASVISFVLPFVPRVRFGK